MIRNIYDTEADYLLNLIANEFKIGLVELKTKGRGRVKVTAKRLFCAIFKEVLGSRVGLDYVGSLIGNMHHSTVIHSIKVHNTAASIRKKDKRLNSYFSIYDKVKEEFSQMIGSIELTDMEKLDKFKVERLLMDRRILRLEEDIIIKRHRLRKERRILKNMWIPATL